MIRLVDSVRQKELRKHLAALNIQVVALLSKIILTDLELCIEPQNSMYNHQVVSMERQQLVPSEHCN